jgi:hypothetical protein
VREREFSLLRPELQQEPAVLPRDDGVADEVVAGDRPKVGDKA